MKKLKDQLAEEMWRKINNKLLAEISQSLWYQASNQIINSSQILDVWQRVFLLDVIDIRLKKCVGKHETN